MRRLDVHMLCLNDDMHTIRQSLSGMYDVANIFVIPGLRGNIGRARSFGFSLGSAEYASFIDPGDTWFPSAFSICVEALDATPRASFAFTKELVDGKPSPFFSLGANFFHGCIVFRRSVLRKIEDMVPAFEFCHEVQHRCRLALTCGPCIFCDVIGRDWRRSPMGASTMCSRSDNVAALGLKREVGYALSVEPWRFILKYSGRAPV